MLCTPSPHISHVKMSTCVLRDLKCIVSLVSLVFSALCAVHEWLHMSLSTGEGASRSELSLSPRAARRAAARARPRGAGARGPGAGGVARRSAWRRMNFSLCVHIPLGREYCSPKRNTTLHKYISRAGLSDPAPLRPAPGPQRRGARTTCATAGQHTPTLRRELAHLSPHGPHLRSHSPLISCRQRPAAELALLARRGHGSRRPHAGGAALTWACPARGIARWRQRRRSSRRRAYRPPRARARRRSWCLPAT